MSDWLTPTLQDVGIIAAPVVSALVYGLPPRRELKRRRDVELRAALERAAAAEARSADAGDQIEAQKRIIRNLYEGLEGVQRPFDREALKLMSAIRSHNAEHAP